MCYRVATSLCRLIQSAFSKFCLFCAFAFTFCDCISINLHYTSTHTSHTRTHTREEKLAQRHAAFSLSVFLADFCSHNAHYSYNRIIQYYIVCLLAGNTFSKSKLFIGSHKLSINTPTAAVQQLLQLHLNSLSLFLSVSPLLPDYRSILGLPLFPCSLGLLQIYLFGIQ